jgi:UvrD-like helicase C-terminal domain/AAA domain
VAIDYFVTKDFERSLKAAFLGGGLRQRVAKKVKEILGNVILGEPDPFKGTQTTNHGETRIRSCVKYDFPDAWRLVTQQSNGKCIFLFLGDHDDVDHWLDGHENQEFGVIDGRAVLVPGRAYPIDRPKRDYAGHHDEPLVDLLDAALMDHVLGKLPRSIARSLESLNGRTSLSQLGTIVAMIENNENAELVQAVFSLLLDGNHDGAQKRIELSLGIIKPLDEADILEVRDGEDVRRLRIGSPEHQKWLEAFERRSPWYEWFLFLHPEQEKVVQADYAGVAQLSGVSGSGKTCVAVRRALRLAEAPNSKVLLLTLNRSLAGLLNQLVDAACNDEAVRNRIKVTSFFELAQDLLHVLEPRNDRRYADVTWKLGEHVDEVFREYYRRWTNNNDAAVLLPLHKSMTARGVSGENYIREEFDWIRSAVRPPARADYLTLERKGRKFPIQPERRQDLVSGLEGWEKKMLDVGVIDYLGLTSALINHLDKLEPTYSNILVDEAQDFGTTELSVIRQLVQVGPNDIFLCGDIAQTILPKHRSLSDAGLAGITRERIRQNYRNSREILHAAYDVLKNNLHEEMFQNEDLEILDPKFANFSGSVPMALAANSLEEEIAYARSYAHTRLKQDAKTVCIAFAGFSGRDVKKFADKCGVTALDGTYDPISNRLVFCDLEQAKGYEFDTLIIVQCKDGVLPPYDAPKEEAFRASCKLYVAMTRAKRELILSFHDAASPWIAAVTDTIAADQWSAVETLDTSLLQGTPEILPEFEPDQNLENFGKLSGIQFIYTAHALGLSPEAQEKLVDLVDGRGLLAAGGGGRLKWRDMSSMLADIRASRRYDQRFGVNVATELRGLLLGVQAADKLGG